MIITIDGPVAAGKTTAARELAIRLGYTLLDTGAIYRSLALTARNRGIDYDDEVALAAAEPAPYSVPDQDLRISLRRVPALPPGGLRVRLRD